MAGSFRSFALRGAGIALIVVAFPVLLYGIILMMSEYRPTDNL